jgi:hypothetical protein
MPFLMMINSFCLFLCEDLIEIYLDQSKLMTNKI